MKIPENYPVLGMRVGGLTQHNHLRAVTYRLSLDKPGRTGKKQVWVCQIKRIADRERFLLNPNDACQGIFGRR